MCFPASGARVRSSWSKRSWSLTDFPPRFYNFLIFISYALKDIRSIGQSIRRTGAWVVERMMLCLEQILGFNLIYPFGGQVKIGGPASSPKELDDHLPQGGREEKDNVT